MKKSYWISLYTKIEDAEKLKAYAEKVTPIIKSYGGVPLIRGGRCEIFEGENILRTVVWEFPNFEIAKQCLESKEYQEGWYIAKGSTIRLMQIVEGFSTE